MLRSVLLVTAGVALTAPAARAAPLAIASCSADKIHAAMAACDSLVSISQIKCDNTACHKALHLLVDDEYIACYEELKLGSKADLGVYKELDDFCHGEGPDPLEKASANTTSAGSRGTAPPETTVTATPPPTVPSPSSVRTTSAAPIAGALTGVVLAAGMAVLV